MYIYVKHNCAQQASARCRTQKFSKVSFTVTLYSTCSSELTFENVYCSIRRKTR